MLGDVVQQLLSTAEYGGREPLRNVRVGRRDAGVHADVGVRLAELAAQPRQRGGDAQVVEHGRPQIRGDGADFADALLYALDRPNE